MEAAVATNDPGLSRNRAELAGARGVELGIEVLPLRGLRPAQRNPRTHSKKQIRQIADSMRRFGFINPLIVDDRGRIMAGHARAEAAKLLGLSQLPVIRLSHLTETEVRAYLLADNKLAENAGWDRELLAIELEELRIACLRWVSTLALRGSNPVRSIRS
jgi:ParB-like chromosome segregation protein Spo0J